MAGETWTRAELQGLWNRVAGSLWNRQNNSPAAEACAALRARITSQRPDQALPPSPSPPGTVTVTRMWGRVRFAAVPRPGGGTGFRMTVVPSTGAREVTQECVGTDVACALALAVLDAPDQAAAMRAVLTVIEGLPDVTPPGRCTTPDRERVHTITAVQALLAVPVRRAHGAIVVPVRADGRFEVVGAVEPFPGAWPREALGHALGGDVSLLWPYLLR